MSPGQTTAAPASHQWLKRATLLGIPLALLLLFLISVARRAYVEPLFVHTTYFFLLLTVAVWLATILVSARGVRRVDVITWVNDNRAGIALALIVTVVAAMAVAPALRLLSDEAGLVGTSRNLFFKKVPTYTTASKYYYDQFWETAAAIDQRPCLFPFLLNLVHVVRGYSYANAFLFNLLLLPVVVLVAYRIAKILGGELLGLVAALLMASHPTLLITARSGAFDVLSTLFALLIAHGFLIHARAPSPARLATLWMHLCMFAEIRYESALFIPPVVLLLLLFRLAPLNQLRPFALVYALTPVYLLPRVWQSMLLGNVPEQVPGAVTFGIQNVGDNVREYFRPMWTPLAWHLPHAGAVIALGVVGALFGARWLVARMRARDWQAPPVRFAALVIAWMALQAGILFVYVWGRAQHPAAARLFIVLDTFFAFLAAWPLVWALRRAPRFVTLMAATAVFVIYLPTAAEQRVFKEMTLTREAATTWRFFEGLHEKRIMIVAERPALYTIMEYGALDYASARQDAYLLTALSRRLFHDVYVVQKIDLATHQPLPQHDIWADRQRDVMLEFQNDANTAIRISRLRRDAAHAPE